MAAARSTAKTKPRTADPLARLRAICLALPDGKEKEAWGTPTFRVGDKMLCMFTDNHHGDGRVSMWCKGTLDVQEILVGAEPKRFFVPPYVGHKGWIGMRLDGAVDWDVVEDLVKDAYRMTAPKRLVAQLDGKDVAPEPPRRRARTSRATARPRS